jgi:hypothetical protein
MATNIETIFIRPKQYRKLFIKLLPVLVIVLATMIQMLSISRINLIRSKTTKIIITKINITMLIIIL